MLEKGKLLAGRYRLEEQIDSGGTAYIYRATDERTDYTVAVKVLKPEFTDNEEFILRFKKEVQASLKLKHANIIRAYDAGLDDGTYYIVMDLIEGQTLKNLINKNGPLPLKYVVTVAKKLCLALEYAHVKGFVHRDIKPHNVMVDKTGEPFIGDFGIARDVESNTITAEETSVMGSVHYFSPEQARGERVDKRSDIYSLGILMFEMLTGEVPFDADTSVAIALKHINDPLPDIDEYAEGVPESVKKIILKAAQKDKHFRYKTPFSMYEDLQKCLNEPDGEYIKYTESKRVQQRMEEARAHKNKRSIKKLFLIIGLSILIVAVAALITSAVIDGNAQKPQMMPYLVGMSEQNARDTLDEYDVVLMSVSFEYSDKPEGIVINQKPAQNIEIQPGVEVELTISKGQAASVEFMPDVTGISLEEAKEILLQSGLELAGTYDQAEGEIPIGFVIDQQPGQGVRLEENEAIYLTVKISPDDIKEKVPRVIGENIEQAVYALNEAKFNQIFIASDTQDAVPGTVLAQTPEPDVEHPVTKGVVLTMEEYDYTSYYYEGTVNIEVPDNNSSVRIAIKDTVGDTVVYYLVYDSVMEAGAQEIPVEISLPINTAEDEQTRQLSVFLNDNMVDYYDIVLVGN